MEVGQVDNIKIGAIIQARYSSVRLPGKVLLPLPLASGKPIIEHILTTLKRNELVNETIIATSHSTANDPIRNLADRVNVKCFSGDENDVISRFISILEEYKFSICIRLTGDNPLVDNNKLNEALNYFITEDLDYLYTCGLPLGMNFEIFKSQALLSCKEFELTDSDKEHVTLFLRESGKFKSGIINFTTSNKISNLRCTIDYASDFAFLNLLMSLINYSSDDLLDEITKVVSQYQWISEINSDNFQKNQGLNTIEEINLATKILAKYELKKAIIALENCKL